MDLTTFLSLLTIIGVLFMVMLVGYWCRHRDIINDVSSNRMSKLIIEVGQPLLIIGALISKEFSWELFREGLLGRFCPELPEADTRILERSIRSHSAYRLGADLSETETAYCNVLRDADKIDILRVNCDTPPEDIYNVTTKELKTATVSEAVRQCFYDRTAVPRGLKETPIDFLVAHLCLTFELVYPVSREIAREQGYADQMLAFQSDHPDTQAWFAYMRDNLW
jgi:hypothetical protein